ncbi:MAG: fimbrillin family protein [Tannerellaceae bacterium]
MKKIILSVAAISSLMFASCTNDADQISEAQKEQNAIAFSSYSMLSKGAPIVNNDAFAKIGSSFEVVGFLNDPAGQYMKAQISHNGTNWGYANLLDKAYWPENSKTLTFYAVAPYADFYPAKNGNGIAYAAGAATATYTIPTITSDQQDLMYAFTAALSKPASGGNVTLPFNHALNQIHFKAKTESNNLFVDIDANGIQLCNLKNTGTLSFGAAASLWNSVSGKTTFTATSAAVTDIKSSVSTPISSTSDVLMLMPQSLTAWNPAGEVNATGENQTGAYLKINCKLYTKVGDQKVYFHGGTEAYAALYIPFTGTGMDKMGKKITYTLIFGGGYTDPGEPILTPITFTTEVMDWVDAGNVDIPTQEPAPVPAAN